MGGAGGGGRSPATPGGGRREQRAVRSHPLQVIAKLRLRDVTKFYTLCDAHTRK